MGESTIIGINQSLSSESGDVINTYDKMVDIPIKVKQEKALAKSRVAVQKLFGLLGLNKNRYNNKSQTPY